MLFVFFCKQKTAYEMRISDWSSDVCSSDLIRERRDAQEQRLDRQQHLRAVRQRQQKLAGFDAPRLARETVDLYRALVDTDQRGAGNAGRQRSEERRGGEEGVSTCRFRRSPYH